MTKTKINSKNTNYNGFVFYDGPSLIDGSPILGILTFKSANSKTGNEAQTWIIRKDERPTVANKKGLDRAVCGDCPHRGINGKKRVCYVRLFHAPLGVWKCHTTGKGYLPYDMGLAKLKRNNQTLRLGSYGDPTAIPFEAWKPLLDATNGNTGYTHQWRNCDQAWSDYIMASCDSRFDYVEATIKGWRTFRVKKQGEEPMTGEMVCLAESHDMKCEDCKLCCGNKIKAKNMVITVHGAGKSNFK